MITLTIIGNYLHLRIKAKSSKFKYDAGDYLIMEQTNFKEVRFSPPECIAEHDLIIESSAPCAINPSS